jgi:dihydroorotate dehydrogenase (NAD+) catalytic subunit
MGMAIDVESRRPKLAGTTGGLSGPAIRPIAVRAIHEVHSAFPDVPLIGQGGVSDATDVLELMLAGATAVAIGTANFVNPRVTFESAAGLVDYMKRHRMAVLQEVIGGVRLEDR